MVFYAFGVDQKLIILQSRRIIMWFNLWELPRFERELGILNFDHNTLFQNKSIRYSLYSFWAELVTPLKVITIGTLTKKFQNSDQFNVRNSFFWKNWDLSFTDRFLNCRKELLLFLIFSTNSHSIVNFQNLLDVT